MIAAPGTAGRPSSISTGVVPSGLSARNSSRRSHTRSSTKRGVEAELAERQAHEARMRAERMMEQREHRSGCRIDSSRAISRMHGCR